MPFQRGDGLAVALEGVQFEFQVPEIPDADAVVRTAGCHYAFGGGGEGEGVDGVAVLVGGGGDGGAAGVGLSCVEDLEGDVVGDGADEGWVEGVVLHVVDDGGVVGVGSGRFEEAVGRRKLGDVP